MEEKRYASSEELLDAIIHNDLQNEWLDVYEQETGLEPVPEDGGHTEDFETWLVCRVQAAFANDIRTLREISLFFNIRRNLGPDHSTARTNELAYKFASYGINGAGADESYAQKVFGSECVEVALRLMKSSLLDEITSPDFSVSYTEHELENEWKRLRREAYHLR